jgi:D-alanyl-D-alanine carboxypeptidase/D-alanyl-D-alanine-endopeptidase (penicillin-binding protein 4)
MKTRLSLLLLLACILPASLSGQQEVMDSILADTSFTGTSYSFCFADAVTGEIIFSHDAERNLSSASVMKLYPTSVALSLLGPCYRYSTTLCLAGDFNSRKGVLDGDVIIVGGGDPSLGSTYFSDHYGDLIGNWVQALKNAGIRRVRGRVAASESLYDLSPVPDGWAWGDLGYSYGAGVYDININDNKFNIYITGRSEGQPAIIDSLDRYGRAISVTGNLVSSGRSNRSDFWIAPWASAGVITGRVPADSSIIFRASVSDPPLALVTILDEAMRSAGIEITGEPGPDRVTAAGRNLLTVAVVTSPPLSEIVRVTNHESVNMYAEAIRKHLGYEILGTGTFSAGSAVIRHFLDSIGCKTEHAVMLDGSGLSSNNNINALMTVKLLVHMHNSNIAGPFEASLPIGAISGTMKNYFRDEVFNGRVVAKTGTITSAKSFAGYFTTNSGRRIAFTTFANGFTVPSRMITDNMERIVREIILKY